MKRKAITFVEVIVVVAIIVILAAILMPAFNRPARFYDAVIPPQQFRQVPLQSVMEKLDRALQASRKAKGKKSAKNFQKRVWESEDLKSRRLTLSTEIPLTLKEVLAKLKDTARIGISFGPGCGTCGSFDGPTTIYDQSGQPASKRGSVEAQL